MIEITRLIEVCELIAIDAERDAERFDGKQFDGKTVAEYFGYHGAAISGLANVLKEMLQREAIKPLL